MAAAVKNLLIEQGATFRLVLRIRNAATQAAVNLTGYSARMHVRSTVASSSTLIEATTANGKIVITPSTGVITVTLSATETAALTFASAVYDLETEDSSSPAVVKRRLQGTVTLSREVTR